jgi:uncharacterized protein (TIGR04255 family)
MSDLPFKLKNPPIVEAIIDIECDMPPKFVLSEMEVPAGNALHDHYPSIRKQFVQELKIEAKENAAPSHVVSQGLSSIHFIQSDTKQLVQVRTTGYSFNRLAPYGGLDDHLPEIARTWDVFCKLVKPVQIRLIRLRYINRIELPLSTGIIDLDDYLLTGPRLPDESRLTFTGFLHQYSVLEKTTGHRANIVLTAQPTHAEKLPILFDIGAEAHGRAEPADTKYIMEKIAALRSLKNSIFRDTLTDKCLTLFQQADSP